MAFFKFSDQKLSRKIIPSFQNTNPLYELGIHLGFAAPDYALGLFHDKIPQGGSSTLPASSLALSFAAPDYNIEFDGVSQ